MSRGLKGHLSSIALSNNNYHQQPIKLTAPLYSYLVYWVGSFWYSVISQVNDEYQQSPALDRELQLS